MLNEELDKIDRAASRSPMPTRARHALRRLMFPECRLATWAPPRWWRSLGAASDLVGVSRRQWMSIPNVGEATAFSLMAWARAEFGPTPARVEPPVPDGELHRFCREMIDASFSLFCLEPGPGSGTPRSGAVQEARVPSLARASTPERNHT